jgi:hypothetical protein
MAVAQTKESSWSDVADRVLSLLEDASATSPTIGAVVERGIQFVDCDDKNREIVFDLRALLLGLLIQNAGAADETQKESTASWFSEWIEQTLGTGTIDRVLAQGSRTPPEQVFTGLAKGYQVILSGSLKRLLDPATKIAQVTLGRATPKMRHLFAVMIEDREAIDGINRIFNNRLSSSHLSDLKQKLFGHIIKVAPNSGDNIKAWTEYLRLPAPPVAEPLTPKNIPSAAATVPGEDRIAGFSKDTVAGAGDDLLDTSADVLALARLICLENAAPLAVAIFGGWGSGKSTFMERIDAAVGKITKAAQESGRAPKANEASFVQHVVPIRFNAWQFVDANLWASLTAEFFDQLRAGGWRRSNSARHAELVEKVNSHVRALSAEADASRRAAAQGDKELLEAQKARDAAAGAARQATGEKLGQAVVNALSDAYEAEKPNLRALGLSTSGKDADESVEMFLKVVRDSGSFLRQIYAVVEVLKKSPQRRALILILLAVGLFSAGFG